MTRVLMSSAPLAVQRTAASSLRAAGRPALPFRIRRDNAATDPGIPVHRLLGLIRYGDSDDREAASPLPTAHIPLRCLDHGPVTLMWLGRPVIGGSPVDRLACRFDGETLFGVYQDERAEPATIENTTDAAYRAMLEAAYSAGYPHIHRIWNYLPDINREIAGLEVYQAFCIGRQRAFDRDPLPAGAAVPAACAIGTPIPGFSLYFLAGQQPAVPLSNPRQVEAYQYPPQYGPRSPAFSRAVLVPQGCSALLHLSGTASIVGHESRHLDRVQAQLSETLANLAALLQQVGIVFSDLGDNAFFTVYLRHEPHFPLVRDQLAEVLPPAVDRIFLQGDICRSSLLLEIEGIIALPGTVRPDASPPPRKRPIHRSS